MISVTPRLVVMDSMGQDCVYPVETASRPHAPRQHLPRAAGEEEYDRPREVARPSRTEACISKSLDVT